MELSLGLDYLEPPHEVSDPAEKQKKKKSIETVRFYLFERT